MAYGTRRPARRMRPFIKRTLQRERQRLDLLSMTQNLLDGNCCKTRLDLPYAAYRSISSCEGTWIAVSALRLQAPATNAKTQPNRPW
jgi:hypothetical protein